jgi:hypothetical protein
LTAPQTGAGVTGVMAQSLSKIYVHLSFSTKDRERVYIRNQREHHRVKSFQEELRAFLKAYEIEFDERYVWD